MGVLSCHREYCPNIMCTKYSSEFGYICDECFEELVETGPNTDIQDFMDKPRDDQFPLDKDLARLHYEKIFGD